MAARLRFCTRCGQPVDPYPPSTASLRDAFEYGQAPEGLDAEPHYTCASCGERWLAMSTADTGRPCPRCRGFAALAARCCGYCGGPLNGKAANPGARPTMKRRFAGLATATVLFAVSVILWWATWTWALRPSGTSIFQRWSLLWVFAFIGALATLPIALLTAVFRRARRKALAVALCCVAIVAGWYVGSLVGSRQYHRRLSEIPARAAPLIAAIERFERDQHHPPARLEELVPLYLGAIPSTEFGGYPAWFYERGPFDGDRLHELYGSNAWALSFYVSLRPVASYRLLYLPDKRYPGTATRIGSWARMHY